MREIKEKVIQICPQVFNVSTTNHAVHTETVVEFFPNLD